MQLSHRQKTGIVTAFALIAFISVFFIAPIPQDPSYHQFADQRNIFGVPNFWNVISNVGFLAVGTAGLIKIRAMQNASGSFTFFYAGIFLTSAGSAWYHLVPSNASLIWDRIPMSVAFSSLLSAVIADRINPRAEKLLLFPLLALAVLATLYWYYTERQGAGDLRFYGFVQFGTMLFIPLIFLLFREGKIRGVSFLFMLVFYVAAKLCESDDECLLDYTGLSGHSWKHLLAAIAVSPMLHPKAFRSSTV
jgi:hypothetical protein